MGNVNITLANGRLGATLQTNDGIAGMVLTGRSETGGYTLGTPILLSGWTDLASAGISEAGNPFAYRQVKEFYAEAGESSMLYLMLVGNTVKVEKIADYTFAEGARKLLDFAAGRIRLLGVMTDDAAVYGSGTPLVTAAGINDDVYAAATNMGVMARHYFEAEQPFRALLGGTSYNGTAATLTDVSAGSTNNRTAIIVGDTQPGAGACLGLALGRLSAVPVQRKLSRVRSGGLSCTAAFLGTHAVTAALALPVADKGFITFKTYPNMGGYYFSGDGTCSASTDDYHFLARGRVMDKAHLVAYAVFVQEVDEEVLVNDDGTLDAGFCKWLSQRIVNQIANAMIATGQVGSATCFIDPSQQILSTGRLNVVIRLTPVGYATDIEINLGFDNPATA
jgi:Protein of unknown function (DUF2586)